MKNLLLMILASALISGCSVYRIDSQDTTLDFYPPKNSPEKIVLVEKADKPYEVIGIVTVTTERTKSFDDILAKMKAEAATLGGDAIMDIKHDASGAWKKVLPGSFKNAYIHANYSAKVIVWK